MFKNKLEKLIKTKDENNVGNDKRKIENLVFFVIVLIITIVIINYVWNGKKSSNKTITNSAGKQLASQTSQSNNTQINEDDNQLEGKLETILEKIEGVGNVKVFINYSESSETVAMYNENSKTSTTEETDKSGGTRKIEQIDSDKEVIYQEVDGNKTPIVQKKIQPKIEGAIITAKGASNPTIKTNIIQAVEATTGLATHKIQVFEMSQ